jgi:hypothetical protein
VGFVGGPHENTHKNPRVFRGHNLTREEEATMIDEIAQLKADLADLNMKCQLARDNEVRFALQRGRLEAERTNLLVKMVEALAPTTGPVASPSAVTPSPAPYNITMSSALTCPRGREAPAAIPVTLREPSSKQAKPAGKHKPKPANLPTMEEMIFAVLQGGLWMRPNQVTAAIRARYWPDAPRNAAPPVAWRLGRAGRLERGDDGYRLPTLKSNGQFGAQ